LSASLKRAPSPEGTVVLTDELLESLPAEPTDDLKGFYVGSAQVMLIPQWFVSAELTENERIPLLRRLLYGREPLTLLSRVEADPA
jgi:hypothetical protein